MNEVLKVIKERRSTRRFSPEQISNKELNQILEAGLFAPSAHNQQSWNFTVIQNKEVIDQLSHDTKFQLGLSEEERTRALATNEKFHVFYNAPTIVVVSGQVDGMMPQVDCAAASQNMLLTAESLQIGSCWNGFVGVLFASENAGGYIEKLGIPEGYQPYYALAFGYKGTEQLTAPKRKDNKIQYIR